MKNELLEIGFQEKDAEVYLALLKLGGAGIAEITKKNLYREKNYLRCS